MMSAVYWTGQLLVKKEVRVGRMGGGRCCSWEPILSLWSDWLVDSERPQQCSKERTAAAIRRDLSSASSSAVFPYYSQRFNCRDTQAAIFLLSHSRESGEKKKRKPYLLALFQRNLSSLQWNKSCLSTEIHVSPTSQSMERFHRKGGKSSDHTARIDIVWMPVCMCFLALEQTNPSL